jgi:hypothetical protein
MTPLEFGFQMQPLLRGQVAVVVKLLQGLAEHAPLVQRHAVSALQDASNEYWH